MTEQMELFTFNEVPSGFAKDGNLCFNLSEQISKPSKIMRKFRRVMLQEKNFYSERAPLRWSLIETNSNYILYKLNLEKSKLLPTPLASDCFFRKPSVKFKTKNLNYQAVYGLLPTPRASDSAGGAAKKIHLSKTGTWVRGIKDFSLQLRDLADKNLLPTPLASDCTENAHKLKLTEGKITRENGFTFIGLNDLAMNNILPIMVKKENFSEQELNAILEKNERKYLNPFFVEEMMGFPFGWTLKAFLNKDFE